MASHKCTRSQRQNFLRQFLVEHDATSSDITNSKAGPQRTKAKSNHRFAGKAPFPSNNLGQLFLGATQFRSRRRSHKLTSDVNIQRRSHTIFTCLFWAEKWIGLGSSKSIYFILFLTIWAWSSRNSDAKEVFRMHIFPSWSFKSRLLLKVLTLNVIYMQWAALVLHYVWDYTCT